MLRKPVVDTTWRNCSNQLPPARKDVEIMRKDGSTELGYYYISKIRKEKVTWIDSNSYMIRENPVIKWKPKERKII